MDTKNFEITKTIKSNPHYDGLLFSKIKDYVLGKSYSLSLVFVGDKLSQRLNKEWRKKDKPANILSFPLEEKSGEIFINYSMVLRTYKSKTEIQKRVAYLLIHGLLHLEGLPHGSKMDSEEERILKKFKI